VYKISRREQWPPHIDLTTARETLAYMHDDMKRVPQLAKVAAALEAAMQEMDRAETANPRRIARNVITASRFLRARH
jgi:hypothetical protein